MCTASNGPPCANTAPGRGRTVPYSPVRPAFNLARVGLSLFPVTAPLAWAACQLQHLPRYPSLTRNARACPPGLPTRSRRTPFPAVAAHSNRSLLGAVSVAGKRNFEARDKGAEMAVGIHLAARRDHAPARKPANSGLFAKSREISVLSNLAPDEYERPCCGQKYFVRRNARRRY